MPRLRAHRDEGGPIRSNVDVEAILMSRPLYRLGKDVLPRTPTPASVVPPSPTKGAFFKTPPS